MGVVAPRNWQVLQIRALSPTHTRYKTNVLLPIYHHTDGNTYVPNNRHLETSSQSPTPSPLCQVSWVWSLSLTSCVSEDQRVWDSGPKRFTERLGMKQIVVTWGNTKGEKFLHSIYCLISCFCCCSLIAIIPSETEFPGHYKFQQLAEPALKDLIKEYMLERRIVNVLYTQ